MSLREARRAAGRGRRRGRTEPGRRAGPPRLGSAALLCGRSVARGPPRRSGGLGGRRGGLATAVRGDVTESRRTRSGACGSALPESCSTRPCPEAGHAGGAATSSSSPRPWGARARSCAELRSFREEGLVRTRPGGLVLSGAEALVRIGAGELRRGDLGHTRRHRGHARLAAGCKRAACSPSITPPLPWSSSRGADARCLLLVSVQLMELLWVALNLLGVEKRTTTAPVVHWSPTSTWRSCPGRTRWPRCSELRCWSGWCAGSRVSGSSGWYWGSVASRTWSWTSSPTTTTSRSPRAFRPDSGLGSVYGSAPMVAFLLELAYGVLCWRDLPRESGPAGRDRRLQHGEPVLLLRCVAGSRGASGQPSHRAGPGHPGADCR